MLAYDGRVDGDSLGGYGVQGTLRFEGLDLRTLLDTVVTPPTALSGTVELDVVGDSLPNLAGSALLRLERSRVDGNLIYDAYARARFADGRARIDTASMLSVAGTATARGALGLSAAVRDTLGLTVEIDSLGGLRRYLSSASPGDTVPLTGRVQAGLSLIGSLATLGVSGWVDGRELVISNLRVRHLRVMPDFADVNGAIGGSASLQADTLDVAGVRVDMLRGNLSLSEGRTGQFSFIATAANGPVLQSSGDLRFFGDTTGILVDSLSLMFEDHQFALERPTTVRVSPADDDRPVVPTGPGAQRWLAADLRMPRCEAPGVTALPLGARVRGEQYLFSLGGELTASRCRGARERRHARWRPSTACPGRRRDARLDGCRVRGPSGHGTAAVRRTRRC